MDRIKRLSLKVLEQHKEKFGINFLDNKKVLDEISVVRSKGLKNEVAGYITKFLKHEMLDKKKKEEQIARQNKIEENIQDPQKNSPPTKVPIASEPTSNEPKRNEIS